MNPNESARQFQNRRLAVGLVDALMRGRDMDASSADRDDVWEAFIDFYTRMDKHNCPTNPENQPNFGQMKSAYSLQDFYGGPNPMATLPKPSHKKQGMKWTILGNDPMVAESKFKPAFDDEESEAD